jgi:hypothetical protein
MVQPDTTVIALVVSLLIIHYFNCYTFCAEFYLFCFKKSIVSYKYCLVFLKIGQCLLSSTHKLIEHLSVVFLLLCIAPIFLNIKRLN